MTLLEDPRIEPSFGSGGAEPYGRALRSHVGEVLLLRGGGADAALDLDRWRADADAADLRLLSGVAGPVLDIGCGPGRMVRAALDLGLEASGVDLSADAVEHARERGLPVIRGSVFGPLPAERHWRTLLLLDGNVGIGGDVRALLLRCRHLMSARGSVIVELHRDDDRDHRFAGRVVDQAGRESGAFPWAEIGLAAIVPLAADAGLEVAQDWTDGDRVFCTLRRIAR